MGSHGDRRKSDAPRVAPSAYTAIGLVVFSVLVVVSLAAATLDLAQLGWGRGSGDSTAGAEAPGTGRRWIDAPIERQVAAWRRDRGTTPMRVIPVVAYGDARFRRAAGGPWEDDIARRVGAASREFERVFRLSFELVETRAWETGWETDLGALQRGLAAQPRQADALVIGFTGKRRFDDWRGVSYYFGSTIVVRTNDVWGPWQYEHETLLHELAHTFGAFHTCDVASVMRADKEGDPVAVFDDQTIAVVSRLRDIDLTRNVDGLTAEHVNFVTEVFRAGRAPRTPHPVTHALVTRTDLALRRGDVEEAQRLFDRANGLVSALRRRLANLALPKGYLAVFHKLRRHRKTR